MFEFSWFLSSPKTKHAAMNHWAHAQTQNDVSQIGPHVASRVTDCYLMQGDRPLKKSYGIAFLMHFYAIFGPIWARPGPVWGRNPPRKTTFLLITLFFIPNRFKWIQRFVDNVFFRFLAAIRLRSIIKLPQQASFGTKMCSFGTSITLPQITIWGMSLGVHLAVGASMFHQSWTFFLQIWAGSALLPPRVFYYWHDLLLTIECLS